MASVFPVYQSPLGARLNPRVPTYLIIFRPQKNVSIRVLQIRKTEAQRVKVTQLVSLRQKVSRSALLQSLTGHCTNGRKIWKRVAQPNCPSPEWDQPGSEACASVQGPIPTAGKNGAQLYTCHACIIMLALQSLSCPPHS